MSEGVLITFGEDEEYRRLKAKEKDGGQAFLKTEQNMYISRPYVSQDALVLTLMCVQCKTFRSFVFDESLKAVVSRKNFGMSTKASCDECGVRIGFSLMWANKRPKFHARNPVDAYEGEVISVTDGVPMVKEGEPDGRNHSTHSQPG